MQLIAGIVQSDEFCEIKTNYDAVFIQILFPIWHLPWMDPGGIPDSCRQWLAAVVYYFIKTALIPLFTCCSICLNQ